MSVLLNVGPKARNVRWLRRMLHLVSNGDANGTDRQTDGRTPDSYITPWLGQRNNILSILNDKPINTQKMWLKGNR